VLEKIQQGGPRTGSSSPTARLCSSLDENWGQRHDFYAATHPSANSRVSQLLNSIRQQDDFSPRNFFVFATQFSRFAKFDFAFSRFLQIR
jgi:hypothetical protein